MGPDQGIYSRLHPRVPASWELVRHPIKVSEIHRTIVEESGIHPDTARKDVLAERHDFAPRPWPILDQNGGGPNAQSTWAFNLTANGRTIATLTARRRLSRADFEPTDFAAALQGLIERFVAAPQDSRGEPVAAAGHPDAAANVATPASPLDQ